MLTLGYKASAEQFAQTDLLRFVVLAEELGFGSVVVSDQLHRWRNTGGHAPFSFAWLGALEAKTSRVRRRREAVRPMKRLWSEDYVTFDGKYYRTREAKIFDKPVDGAPLSSQPRDRGPRRSPAKRPTASSAQAARATSCAANRRVRPSTRGRARPAAPPTASRRRSAALALPADEKAGVEDPRETARSLRLYARDILSRLRA